MDEVTPRFIAAQIVGFCAMATAIYCFQQKGRKKILIWQIICTTLWVINFIVLGNMTGCIINATQVLRTIVFSFKEKHKWAQNNIWPVVFCVIAVIAGVLTWDGVWSLFPMFGMMFSTVSLWMTNPKYIRILTLPVAGLWFVYDLHCMSYAGACNEILCMCSILIAMWRYDRKNSCTNEGTESFPENK